MDIARKFYGYLKKDLLLIVNRKKYLYLTLLLPFIVAVIFLLMITPSLGRIDVGVCDFDRSEYTSEALSGLKGSFNIEVLPAENCISNLTDKIKKGDFSLGLQINKGFSARLQELQQATLAVYYDNTDPAFANLVSWKVDASLQPYEERIIDSFNQNIKSQIKAIRFNLDLALELTNNVPLVKPKLKAIDQDLKRLEDMNTGFLVNPIWTNQIPVYEKSSTKDAGIAFIFPTIALFILLMLASTSVMYDKKNHFITRVKSSTSPVVYVLAKLVFFIILTAVQFIVVFLLFMVYGAAYSFSILNLFKLILFIAIIDALLGMMIGLFSDNEGIALLFSLIVSFPLMLLSGIFAPLQTMPGFVQFLAKILPLHHQINAVKSVMLFNSSISNIWILSATVLFVFVYLMVERS